MSRYDDPPASGTLRRVGVAVTALGAWLGLTGSAAVLTAGMRSYGADTAAARLDELLAIIALVATWLLLSWLALSVVISALASTPRAVGGALARLDAAVTPALIRRSVAALVGGAVLAGPVLAMPVASAAVRDPGARPVVAIDGDGSVVFDRPVGVPTRHAPQPESPANPDAARPPVEVRLGDTLWDIAARHLGDDATAAQIAAEWPRWHAANRAVIGSDPGLIRPGQILTPPAA